MISRSCLNFLLFGSDFPSGIGNLHSNLLGSLYDLCSFSGAHIMGDFSTEFTVIHEQNIKILDVMDDKFLKSIR